MVETDKSEGNTDLRCCSYRCVEITLRAMATLAQSVGAMWMFVPGFLGIHYGKKKSNFICKSGDGMTHICAGKVYN